MFQLATQSHLEKTGKPNEIPIFKIQCMHLQNVPEKYEQTLLIYVPSRIYPPAATKIALKANILASWKTLQTYLKQHYSSQKHFHKNSNELTLVSQETREHFSNFIIRLLFLKGLSKNPNNLKIFLLKF